MIIFQKLYCQLHKAAKKALKQNIGDIKAVDYPQWYIQENGINKGDVYPVENPVLEYKGNDICSFSGKKQKMQYTCDITRAKKLWEQFCVNSEIPFGYKGAGLSYAGYILDKSSWCLPSWVWTSAALVRRYCLEKRQDKAVALGEIFLDLQEECGGWIVRNDYKNGRVIPQLAPNDSAYIANNACISIFELTKDKRYLDSAKRCADWIIDTARPDGFVYLGFDTLRGEWIKDKNIVDTGFTAALFAKLYKLTEDEKYKVFLERFVKRYIDIFYNEKTHMFATGIDKDDNQLGGAFGRGQAWALEGLICAYDVIGSRELYNVINNTVSTILNHQNKDGSWPYNFSRRLMGDDAKAVSVIAYSLINWYKQTNNKDLLNAAKRGIDWCVRHTQTVGEAAGGIFSFTLEGAVVHHLYTHTAFVYASSYAIEVLSELEGEIID